MRVVAGGVLVAADYSQLELRMIAHLSQDAKLIRILNEGGDVFRTIAAQWKSVEPQHVTAEQRQHAKQVPHSPSATVTDNTHGDISVASRVYMRFGNPRT